MDERIRFVARLLEGEKMTPLCAEFGISRKTGYTCSTGTRTAASRRLRIGVGGRIAAPKIREKLRRQSTAPHLPAISTVHAVLDRHKLVKRRRRGRPGATGTTRSRPTEPNALWCADSKGEFMLGDRRYCYPLTITDFASRYRLTCEARSTTQERFAFSVFEQTFKEFGLPQAIRTDNGVPFASGHALYA